MLTIENISNDHITLNAHPASPITLASKGAQHIFKDEKSYSPYQFAVSALLQAGKLLLKKEGPPKAHNSEKGPTEQMTTAKTSDDSSEQKEGKKPIKKTGTA